jgi:hypothetical protein
MKQEEGRKNFFFGKKQQKTFAPLRACVAPAVACLENQGFFAAFCSQKAVLALFHLKTGP